MSSSAVRPPLTVLRILDANFNRASEGLRVIEEFVRFERNDALLSAECKTLRHRLMVAFQVFDVRELLTARDTASDPGTSITLATETQRAQSEDVVRANFQRLQQALRSLEEYGKTCAPAFSAEMEQIRYRTYTLEKAILSGAARQSRMAQAQLYALLDGRDSLAEFRELAQTLVTAGVQVIQLRDKRLPDRLLLERAHALRAVTRGTKTLMVMNDRPDLAVLAEADGVHVGQEELTVAEVRRIVGANLLVGVSTHNLAQAQQAYFDGADYIGCGPTFPSTTKAFEQFAGLEYLRQVAEQIRLPAFAIGGITLESLPRVLATGVRRVAVGGGITSASDPACVVQQFLSLLAD